MWLLSCHFGYKPSLLTDTESEPAPSLLLLCSLLLDRAVSAILACLPPPSVPGCQVDIGLARKKRAGLDLSISLKHAPSPVPVVKLGHLESFFSLYLVWESRDGMYRASLEVFVA